MTSFLKGNWLSPRSSASAFSMHTHTLFRVSTEVLKLLDIFRRRKYLGGIQTSWEPQKVESAQNVTSIYALPICAEENFFFFFSDKEEKHTLSII